METTAAGPASAADGATRDQGRSRGPSAAVQGRRPSELGRRIAELRRARGLTQRDLSSGDFSPGYISAVEKGRIIPSIQALRLIAERLGEPPGALLAEPPAADDPELLLEEAAVRLALPDGTGEAVALVRSIDPAGLSLEARLRRRLLLGRAELRGGNLDAAVAELQAGLQEAEAADPTPDVLLWSTRLRDALGAAYRAQGEHTRALNAHRAARQTLRDAGLLQTDPTLTRSVYANLVADLMALDQADEAIETHQELESVGLPPAGPAGIVQRHLEASRRRREAGDGAGALAHLTQAAAVADALIDARVQLFEEGVAAVARVRINGDEALERLRSAVEGARWSGDAGLAASLANDLAEGYRRADRLAEAEAAADQAYRLATEAGLVAERGRALVVRGTVLGQDGRVEQAERVLRQAIELLTPEEQRAGAVLGRAYYRLGKLMLETGRAAEAAPLLERAYRFGERFG